MIARRSVLTTVVSRPSDDRAMIDAGSKALTSDLLGLTGYGAVSAMEGARLYEVNEEHGYLDISAAANKPAVGDLLRVVPNHVCPVMNLFDRVVMVRGDKVLGSGQGRRPRHGAVAVFSLPVRGRRRRLLPRQLHAVDLAEEVDDAGHELVAIAPD